MKNFQVYKHPFFGFECIKIGFSWPAFFFGLFWMLFSRLWLNAFIWVIIYLLTIYISGTQTGNIVFQLGSMLIYLALWLVPAFEGNSWRSAKLEKRGFQFLKIVQAGSKDQAIAIALASENEKPEIQSNLSEIKLSPNSENDFSSHSFSAGRGGIGAYLVGSIIALFVLFFSLLITKPNDSDFFNYLLDEKRIESGLVAEVKPGDSMGAMALIGDIFDLIASGNMNNSDPIIRKKDHHLFVLYSTKMDIKPYDGSFKKLKNFTKVDAFRAMGFNSTYIGFWGTFFRLNNDPFTDGVQVKTNDKDGVELEAEDDTYSDRNETSGLISYEKARSIIEAIPDVSRVAETILKETNDGAEPRLTPGNNDTGYDILDGEKYFSIHFVEQHAEGGELIEKFLVSLDGLKVLAWDIDSEQYQKVNVKTFTIKSKNESTSVPAKEEPLITSTSDTQPQSFLSNEIADTSETVETPQYLYSPEPKYPNLSLRRGHEGKVELKVLVSSDGSPETIDIEKSSGYQQLDESALNAVKKWRFKPAQKGVKKISAYIVVPITFKANQPIVDSTTTPQSADQSL